MKKLLVMIGAAAVACSVLADTYTDSYGQTWTYAVGSDGTSVTLTGISNTALAFDAANFPWTFTKGGTTYTVTNVAASACKGWSAMTGTLSIPGTVKSIGGTLFGKTTTGDCDGGFSGCSGLNGLTIADGVEVFGNGAFAGAVNASVETGALIVPASVKSLGHDFMYYGGVHLKAVWVKGFPTVSSGTQTYADISPYRMIFCSPGDVRTILIGKNTSRLYSNKTLLHENTRGCRVYLPANGKWDANAAIGGTDTVTFKYGPGKELDITIDESTMTLTATPATEHALTNVLASAVNFKQYFGLDTVISITNNIAASVEITEEMLNDVKLNVPTWYITFAVKTQAQLDRVLATVTGPIVADITGAKEEITPPVGRRVAILAPGGVTFNCKKRGLIITFH